MPPSPPTRAQPPMLRAQVTNENLQEALPAVQAALQACQFFAFDLEMTGLFLRDGPQPYLDEIEDRYRQVCASGDTVPARRTVAAGKCVSLLWRDSTCRTSRADPQNSLNIFPCVSLQ